ncbi:lipopolysaccharide biosynthesis protein [Alkalibacterium sp. 20]|uniref:lipopolysaccharide biosynthesis protein n=1 Tax=Alkalibacterium sp. 20 TaxID=1798803 RepID=UPI0009F80A3B|nr:oligosaccharide flippase family protein [Alkalibacterium sp. 20]
MGKIDKNPFYIKIVQFIKYKIGSDKLIKNIAMVTGGTALGQVINMLFSPVITRIYSPEEYGILSVFTSILLISSFSSLKYEVAIPIAKDKYEAYYLFSLSLFVLTSVTLIVGIGVYFFEDVIFQTFNAQSLQPYKYFIPLGIFFQGIYRIYKQWMFRMKNFKLVSKTKVGQTLVGNTTKVVMGLLNFGGVGLVIGRIVSVSAGSFSFYKQYRTIEFKDKRIKLAKIKEIALTYKDFPLFQSSTTAILQFRNQFPVLFLAPLYGTQVVGLYGLASTIVKIPMTLVGQSVMDVFFAEIASIGKDNPKEIKELSNNLLKKLIMIGTLPIILLALIGPYLFTFVFGEEWYEAGIYVRILAIYIFANFMFSPISKIFEVFRKQYIKLLIDLTSLVIMSLVFASAYYFNLDARVTVFLYSVAMAMVYTATYIIAQMVLNKESDK